jgi:hypothetical protein
MMSKREAFMQGHRYRMRAVYQQALKIHSRLPKEVYKEAKPETELQDFAVGDLVKITKMGAQFGEYDRTRVGMNHECHTPLCWHWHSVR